MVGNSQDDPFEYKPLKRHSKLSLKQRRQKMRQTKSTTATQSGRPAGEDPRQLKLLAVVGGQQQQQPTAAASSQLILRLQESPVKQSKQSGTATGGGQAGGYCPMCQLPLDLLAGSRIAPEAHLADCADRSVDTDSSPLPCPDGIECASRQRQHYLQYSHAELARHRDLGFFLDQTTEIVPPTPRYATIVRSSEPGRAMGGGQQQLKKPEGGGGRLGSPPQRNSTPYPAISPIQPPGKRGLSQTAFTERTTGKKLRTEHVQRFLQDVGNQSSDEESDVSESLLARDRQHTLSRPPPPPAAVPSGVDISAISSLAPELRHLVDQAVVTVEQEEAYDGCNLTCDDDLDQGRQRIEDGPHCGPSNTTSHRRRRGSPNGVVQRRPDSPNGAYRQRRPASPVGLAERSSGRVVRTDDRRSQRLRYSETESLCTASPFNNVRAVKDSEELELSLDLNTSVVCCNKIKVPLRGGHHQPLPIEVTASYADRHSPGKQAKITSYLNPRRSGEDHTNTSRPSAATTTTTPAAVTASSQSTSNGKNSSKKQEGNTVTTTTSNSSSSSELGILVLNKASKETAMRWKEIFQQKTTTVVEETRRGKSATEAGGRHFHARDDGDARGGGAKRKCPFYKLIPNTSFAVDAFNFGQIAGVRYYFLSHYHYDHYQGLSRAWSDPIVCSPITGRLITTFLGVADRLVITLPPGEARIVDSVEVRAVEANHCPGSVMFLLRLPAGDAILHTGDFRACPDMESDPAFWNAGRIDRLYLDTTYCQPQYDFPAQELVIQETVSEVASLLKRFPNTVVVVGAYTIGKERIFKAIARSLDSKIWAKPARIKTWSALQDPEINGRVTRDRRVARVHVIEANRISWVELEREFAALPAHYDHVLGVRPTGWTHQTGSTPADSLAAIRTVTRGRISLLEVPYSEHSSFSELKRFVKFLRISSVKQILPTVNLRRRQEMERYFQTWIQEQQQFGS